MQALSDVGDSESTLALQYKVYTYRTGRRCIVIDCSRMQFTIEQAVIKAMHSSKHYHKVWHV